MKVGEFVKVQRKKQHWTQKDLAFYGGVGLRFVRDLEQGKSTLRMDKVNQILGMFSAELAVAPRDRFGLLLACCKSCIGASLRDGDGGVRPCPA